MSEETSGRVFVYGTLRKGASNHWRLEGAEFAGGATVTGWLYTIDWYPGLVLDPGGSQVVGEIYAIPRGMLAALDEFEGEEFERVRAVVQTGSGKGLEVWVYRYREDICGREPMVPADWLHPPPPIP